MIIIAPFNILNDLSPQKKEIGFCIYPELIFEQFEKQFKLNDQIASLENSMHELHKKLKQLNWMCELTLWGVFILVMDTFLK